MEDLNKEVFEAFEVIKNGGIILYPTDTVWGIGCDATNETAVKKIYDLKKRIESKSMLVLVNSDRLLYSIFNHIPEVAFDILDCSEKPTTLVLDQPKNVAKNLIAEDNSLGIRIVNTPFCFRLIERMKKPLVSTSANISGTPTPTSFSEISDEIKKGVDYIVGLNQQEKNGKSSTVIKLTNFRMVKTITKCSFISFN